MPGPLVLVVDDSAELRRFMLLLLRRAGIAAEGAADGEEALRRAAAAPPDVLVTDLGLPGIDGMETRRRMRAICGARTLLVSGAPVTPGMMAEADAWLQKPFASADFVERVRELAARPPLGPAEH